MTGLGLFNCLPRAHVGARTAGLRDRLGPGLLHSLASPHAKLAGLTLVAAGVLWTAVEPPATSGRPTGGPPLDAIGYGVFMAAGPLVTLGFAVGLFHAGSSQDRWLAMIVLIEICCGGAIAAVCVWGGFARGGLHRKAVLVSGKSFDLPQMGIRLAPGHDPACVMAGVLPPGDGGALGTKSLRRRGVWGIVADDDAILANPELRTRCRREKIRLLGEAQFRERWLRRVDIDRLRPSALAANSSIEASLAAKVARRGADMVLSVLLLICTLPLSVLAAAFIKFDSRGPVFSSQERVGLQGRLFRLVVFRSTRVNADPGSDTEGANVAVSGVTRVDRLLQRTRVDELPQSWNVFRGEMSMIGPRPERPFSVPRLTAELPCYNDCTLVKPRITGWAQVNCGHGASVRDARVQLA